MIYRYQELSSTNDFALMNKDTLVFGDVIIADRQTDGHGRFDRKWLSANENNVYLTIVLGEIENVAGISLYTAVILSKVLKDIGVSAKIKWPNDILIYNKKVAGVLVQSIVQKGVAYAIVGIGLNISLSEGEKEAIGVPATSLHEAGANISKDEFIELLLSSFFSRFKEFMSRGFSSIKAEYEINSSLIGEQITVKCNRKELMGKVIGFSETGELLLQDNNQIVAVNSGEVLKVF